MDQPVRATVENPLIEEFADLGPDPARFRLGPCFLLLPFGAPTSVHFTDKVLAEPPRHEVALPKFRLWQEKYLSHGHDDAAKESVARFLERNGFEAVILHEQASNDRAVIEKIEAHNDVGFAVAF